MEDKIFIIGGNHHNTLGVIRSMGGGINDVEIYVIVKSDDSKPYILRSRYISRSWVAKTDEEVLDRLVVEGRKNKDRMVLIVCSDVLSSLVDLHRDKLKEYYYLPGTVEQGGITRLMDKEVQGDLARQNGFCVPESFSLNTKDKTAIDIAFPWIVKPLVSKNGKKTDIERIYSSEEWNNYCERHDSKVIVQRLINKDYEYQLIGLSLKGGEEVIIPGVSHILRPSATTNTGFLLYKSLDNKYGDVLKKGKSFLKATNYSGLFSLEFLRGKDGNDYFMEINFRNDGNAICVTASGFNLPYIWYLYKMGRDYKAEINKSCVKPVYVMPEFTDFSFVIHKKISLFQWLKDVHRTDRFMVYDTYDRAPFIQLLKEYIKRGAEKAYNHMIKLST